MRFVSFLALVVCVVGLMPVSGQDAKDKAVELPKPPEGWKYLEAKDSSYTFLFPTQAPRNGTRERTYRSGQISVKSQINYCITKDKLTLTAEMLNINFPPTVKLSVGDVYKMVADQHKTDGYTVTEMENVKVGKMSGKEFYASKEGEVARVVLFAAKPRLYAMTVTGKFKEDTITPYTDKFVNSMVLTPEAAKAAIVKVKDDAAKQAAARATAKPSEIKWTTDPKLMEIPDAPVSGTIMGQEFITDNAELWGGTLYISQGKTGVFYNAHVQLILWLKAGESYAGKTFIVDPQSNKGNITVRIARIKPGDSSPTDVPFTAGFAMKLEFGEAKNGKISGKIYLCTPDADKTAVAGTFGSKESNQWK